MLRECERVDAQRMYLARGAGPAVPVDACPDHAWLFRDQVGAEEAVARALEKAAMERLDRRCDEAYRAISIPCGLGGLDRHPNGQALLAVHVDRDNRAVVLASSAGALSRITLSERSVFDAGFGEVDFHFVAMTQADMDRVVDTVQLGPPPREDAGHDLSGPSMGPRVEAGERHEAQARAADARDDHVEARLAVATPNGIHAQFQATVHVDALRALRALGLVADEDQDQL